VRPAGQTPSGVGSLKRLGGGRWQTRDERFTIEPESGTWVVLDAEQTDDLGLPLVRGPFGSLNAAKAAIAGARESEPAVSPLAAKVALHRGRPAATRSRALKPHVIEVTKPRARPLPPPQPAPSEPAPPPEPRWILDLKPAERRRAHELVERLTKAGAPDPAATTEREIAGKEPAVAAFAVARAIERLGPKATPAAVVRLLADGEATDLGVRWGLVDGDGRRIVFDSPRPEND
jgi:hypothetical protein